MHCSLSSCSVCHNDTCRITHKLNRAFFSIVNYSNSSNNVAKFKVGGIFFLLTSSWKSRRKVEKESNFIVYESVDCEIIINFQFVEFSNL